MTFEDNFDYCNKILCSIEKSPKSIREISSETKIHVTAVYKMMHLLEKHHLVLAKGVFFNHGKYRIFQCNGSFKSAHLILHRLFQIEFS